MRQLHLLWLLAMLWVLPGLTRLRLLWLSRFTHKPRQFLSQLIVSVR